jgi:hypothetical protein
MKQITYVNKNVQPMSFDVGREHYVVLPGETVDIPAKFEYAVECMGLLLDKADESVRMKELTPKAATEMKAEVKSDKEKEDKGSKKKEALSF